MNCGRCHKCGETIKIVLDGEEYCPNCQQYQRPVAHGWDRAYGDDSPCPGSEETLELPPSVTARRLSW